MATGNKNIKEQILALKNQPELRGWNRVLFSIGLLFTMLFSLLHVYKAHPSEHMLALINSAEPFLLISALVFMGFAMFRHAKETIPPPLEPKSDTAKSPTDNKL